MNDGPAGLSGVDARLTSGNEGTPSGLPGTTRRLLATLFAAQVCGSTGNSVGLAVGSIVAAEITGTNTWAGLPVGVSLLGTALASLPLSHHMGRFGRRPGLVLGYAIGALGGVFCVAAVLNTSFLFLLLGMLLLGIGQASNFLARYAAADVSPGGRRGTAISLVIWGATVGALAGPNLLGPSSVWAGALRLPSVAGPFLIGLGGFGLAAGLLGVLLRPDPLDVARRLREPGPADRPVERSRPVVVILRQPSVRVALAALMMSQLVMIATTSTAPVYLHGHGHHLSTIGLVVSAHLAGMYAASPLTGWLSDRIGRLAVLAAGGLILILAVALAAVAPAGDSALVTLALFLNGVGWNFGFVAGSALLTDSLGPGEQPSIQGLVDLIVGVMGAAGSAIGGLVLQAWGFPVLNVFGAMLVLVPLTATWLRRELLSPQRVESNPSPT